MQAVQDHHDVCDNETETSARKDVAKSSEKVIALTRFSFIFSVLTKIIRLTWKSIISMSIRSINLIEINMPLILPGSPVCKYRYTYGAIKTGQS